MAKRRKFEEFLILWPQKLSVESSLLKFVSFKSILDMTMLWVPWVWRTVTPLFEKSWLRPCPQGRNFLKYTIYILSPWNTRRNFRRAVRFYVFFFQLIPLHVLRNNVPSLESCWHFSIDLLQHLSQNVHRYNEYSCTAELLFLNLHKQYILRFYGSTF